MSDKDRTTSGSQTLMRGLDVIEAVAQGHDTSARLAETLGLTRPTAHRLAASLVERGYLAFTPREGYRLGSQLFALGHLAQQQTDVVQLARPHIEILATTSDDTVHLAIKDGDQALYLDKVPGRRRITISSRIGDRQPLTSTGIGKALMIDHTPEYWTERLSREQRDADVEMWCRRMADYVSAGRAFDLEENEDQIRCVAAPIRDASGAIVAAVSVSSAAQYMADERMIALGDDIRTTASAISAELGWKPAPADPGSCTDDTGEGPANAS